MATISVIFERIDADDADIFPAGATAAERFAQHCREFGNETLTLRAAHRALGGVIFLVDVETRGRTQAEVCSDLQAAYDDGAAGFFTIVPAGA